MTSVFDVLSGAFGIIILNELGFFASYIYLTYIQTHHHEFSGADDFLVLEIDQDVHISGYLWSMIGFLITCIYSPVNSFNDRIGDIVNTTAPEWVSICVNIEIVWYYLSPIWLILIHCIRKRCCASEEENPESATPQMIETRPSQVYIRGDSNTSVAPLNITAQISRQPESSNFE